jgi:hypothetical protein
MATAQLAAPLSASDPLTLVALCVLASATLVALVIALQLARQIRAERGESARREAALRESIAAQLSQIEGRLVAHRNESALFLQAIFTGVQGLARNLDAARSTTAMTLEEVRQKLPAPGEHPFLAHRFDTVPDLAPPAVEPVHPRQETRGANR